MPIFFALSARLAEIPEPGNATTPIGSDLEQFGGVVAGEFEGVAPLDEAEALRDQALELDRFHLGAVLFGLALALRLLVDVELALDALGLAVEQVDERPQQIGEIVLEAGGDPRSTAGRRRKPHAPDAQA
jgi:hypothetical protein